MSKTKKPKHGGKPDDKPCPHFPKHEHGCPVEPPVTAQDDPIDPPDGPPGGP